MAVERAPADRTLYLFDTFSGLDPRDIEEEKKQFPDTHAMPGRFADAKADELKLRLPTPDKAVIRKGWFPETALDLEDEHFALAVLDAALYAPTLSALKFFFPRMSQGGMIVLFGLNDPMYPGAAKAVARPGSRIWRVADDFPRRRARHRGGHPPVIPFSI